MTMEIAISLNMNKLCNIPKPVKNKRKINSSHQMKITSSMQTRKSNNFYEVLSLRSEDINNVGINDIKRAYRCMALQYHPDVCQIIQTKKNRRDDLLSYKRPMRLSPILFYAKVMTIS